MLVSIQVRATTQSNKKDHGHYYNHLMMMMIIIITTTTTINRHVTHTKHNSTPFKNKTKDQMCKI